jgi:uncharacterized protein (TIGR02996 family)
MAHLNFLRAIRANPADDTARLVYADWLDDHGDADRAEFIRTQCELARGGLDDARRAALVEREGQLLVAQAANWLPSVPYWKTAPRFERGFLVAGPQDHGWLSIRAFLDDLDYWLLNWLGPPLMLSNRTEDRTPNWWARLLACPHLGLVGGLRLNIARLRPGDLRCLIRHPALTELTHLDLGDNDFGNQGARVLAEAPWPKLRTLNLSHTGMGPPGMRDLVASAHLRNLIRLNVRYNPLGRAGAELLADPKHFPNLAFLAVRSTGIGRRGWDAVRGRFLSGLTM